jgi:hypothetical protein
MELTSFTEVRNTREKLRRLERLYEEQSLAPTENAFVRDLSLKSVKMMINQFKEEIARFEARACLPKDQVEKSETDAPVHPTEAG